MPSVHVSPLWQTNRTFAPTHVYRQETKYAITQFASVTHVHTSEDTPYQAPSCISPTLIQFLSSHRHPYCLPNKILEKNKKWLVLVTLVVCEAKHFYLVLYVCSLKTKKIATGRTKQKPTFFFFLEVCYSEGKIGKLYLRIGKTNPWK